MPIERRDYAADTGEVEVTPLSPNMGVLFHSAFMVDSETGSIITLSRIDILHRARVRATAQNGRVRVLFGDEINRNGIFLDSHRPDQKSSLHYRRSRPQRKPVIASQ